MLFYISSVHPLPTDLGSCRTEQLALDKLQSYDSMTNLYLLN